MKKGLKTFSLNARLLVALAAVCTLGFFNSAQAQDASADTTSNGGKLTIGVRAGINGNEMRFSGSTRMTSPNAGAQLGVFAHFQINKWVGQSVEVAWSQTGAKNYRAERGKLYSFYLNNAQINLLSYFKLPVLSVYEPKIFIGPSFNINTYSVANVEGPSYAGGTQSVKYQNNVSDQFKGLDFGIIVGTGVDFDLKFAKLMVDARYRQGISDINNVNQGSYLSFYGSRGNQTVRTNQISVQVGLGFSL